MKTIFKNRFPKLKNKPIKTPSHLRPQLPNTHSKKLKTLEHIPVPLGISELLIPPVRISHMLLYVVSGVANSRSICEVDAVFQGLRFFLLDQRPQ